MPYINIENYTKKINKLPVLDNINLKLSEGRIYALIGSNGSGKTMLIRAVSGLITPDSGKAFVNGLEIGNGVYPESLGLLIENITMFEYLSAFENLKMLNSISVNRISDFEIKEWLETFELNSNDKRTIKKYSLGMRQKVSIIQAFMNKPDLIILDEPTNSLDEHSIQILFDTIKKINEKYGTTFIIASHDNNCIENISDEIIEMRCGKIVC
ncbi:ABC transporter ATP-binding protein [Eubacterium coprostanoligenes]|uniref:ABC transporter ATP-binding protein n=1 Tax=Eubacterium coprostanoligenes TaxID=290054 RepID=UPI0023563B4A|nr:ABC transporter ATP-binding protein [Eubacterium coprostanoligenes]MCI6254173.1 ABC transporter ATP-binding protein [Eubacterium coprostanoligenes]MDY5400913.1 ABC transporter ATP-binding protein [Eubacterium coprostanoligenes]